MRRFPDSVKGPFADWPAFDLVIQAMSGLMSVTGERDGRPMQSAKAWLTWRPACLRLGGSLPPSMIVSARARAPPRGGDARFGFFDAADESVPPPVH